MKKNNFYYLIPFEAQSQKTFLWEMEGLQPFQELIIGWNALRPAYGLYRLSLSLKTKDWSPWLLYAEWGCSSQRSFKNAVGSIEIYQDTVHINDDPATGWRVKIETESVFNLQGFKALYATMPFQLESEVQMDQLITSSFVCLEVPGISQISLTDPRHMRLCSPTATTAVIQYLNKRSSLRPLEFADRVWDDQFDIYGHWVFAAAQAFIELGDEWRVQARYLEDFRTIYSYLKNGLPVVVSVKGPLPGSLHPYEQGHLLVVRGFDPDNNEVLCMDPGYPTDRQTYVAYPLDDFSRSWQRRKNIAYTIDRNVINVSVS